MTTTEILRKEYDYLTKSYEVYGVFVSGPQNYGLATKTTKLNSKAIIIPSFRDLILKEPVNKVVDFGCGKCEVKDIREFVKNLKNQKAEYLETLFTIHFVVNPKYEKLHDEILEKRGDVVWMDVKKSLEYMLALFAKAKTNMTKPTAATKEEIAKTGYHKESLIELLRVTFMIDKFTKRRMYSDVIDGSNLVKFRDKDISKNSAIATAEKYQAVAKETVLSYLKKKNPTFDEEASKWLDDWMVRIIFYSMQRTK